MTPDELRELGETVQLKIIEVGKKRDEIRSILEDIEALIASATEADELLSSAIHHLNTAHEDIDCAADKLSEYI